MTEWAATRFRANVQVAGSCLRELLVPVVLAGSLDELEPVDVTVRPSDETVEALAMKTEHRARIEPVLPRQQRYAHPFRWTSLEKEEGHGASTLLALG